jgi:hypothetical protein
MQNSNHMTHAKDLTKEPPRSPRLRFGGYSILARMIDKGRAELHGTAGEYHYNCGLDQMLFGFKGVDQEEVKKCWRPAPLMRKYLDGLIPTAHQNLPMKSPGGRTHSSIIVHTTIRKNGNGSKKLALHSASTRKLRPFRNTSKPMIA